MVKRVFSVSLAKFFIFLFLHAITGCYSIALAYLLYMWHVAAQICRSAAQLLALGASAHQIHQKLLWQHKNPCSKNEKRKLTNVTSYILLRNQLCCHCHLLAAAALCTPFSYQFRSTLPTSALFYSKKCIWQFSFPFVLVKFCTIHKYTRIYIKLHTLHVSFNSHFLYC